MADEQESKNVQVVKGFLEAQYANEFDLAFNSFAAEDFTWGVSTRNNADLTAAIPWAGRELRGVEGYKELTVRLLESTSRSSFSPKAFSTPAQRCLSPGIFVFGTGRRAN